MKLLPGAPLDPPQNPRSRHSLNPTLPSLMKILPSPKVRQVRSNRSAFTLVELMVVITVIGLMVSMTAPALPSLVKGNRMNTVITGLAGTMEQARQYAIAQNTYVWVAMVSGTSGGESNLSVAVLASKSGIDSASWGDYTTSSFQSTHVQMISKSQTFSQIKFSEAGSFTNTLIPTLPDTQPMVSGTANSPAITADSKSFKVSLPSLSGSQTMNRIIQFTPTGEARNASTTTNAIEFGIQPVQGSVVDGKNVAVLRINGLTGQTTVYRP